jgi:hypothetical protein
MNTTRLIRHWSMGSALSDDRLRHGAASALDIRAAVSAHVDERAPELPAAPGDDAGRPGLLVKPAGGGDWQPLLAGSA